MRSIGGALSVRVLSCLIKGNSINAINIKNEKNSSYISLVFVCFLSHAQIWKVPEGHETRWTSFENPTGAKGTAAQANKGAKGSAFGRSWRETAVYCCLSKDPGSLTVFG